MVETITAATGAQPRGWLSPASSEAHRRLDLLAEAGIEYVANWINDEQPYPMWVKTGTMFAMPYSVEIKRHPGDARPSPERREARRRSRPSHSHR